MPGSPKCRRQPRTRPVWQLSMEHSVWLPNNRGRLSEYRWREEHASSDPGRHLGTSQRLRNPIGRLCRLSGQVSWPRLPRGQRTRRYAPAGIQPKCSTFSWHSSLLRAALSSRVMREIADNRISDINGRNGRTMISASLSLWKLPQGGYEIHYLFT